jgi:hypothetical protein
MDDDDGCFHFAYARVERWYDVEVWNMARNLRAGGFKLLSLVLLLLTSNLL